MHYAINVRMTSTNFPNFSFEPEAERTCDQLASLAIQSDPDNLEALECLASVRMSQSKPDEARSALECAWDLIKNLEPGLCLQLAG